MTTRNWDGSAGSFESASDWLPAGVPVVGDTAIISAGTVTAGSETLAGLQVQLGSATLRLAGSTLGSGSQLTLTAGGTGTLLLDGATIAAGATVTSASGQAGITVSGNTVNRGSIVIQGSGSAITIGAGASLINSGTLTAAGSLNVNASGGVFENDGTIAVTPSAIGPAAIFAASLTGAGTVLLNTHAVFDVSGSVSAGQTVVFAPGASDVLFQDDTAAGLAGTIKGFVSGDKILLTGLPQTTLSYVSTSATGGVLTLSSGGTAVASLNMRGVYTTASFTDRFTDLGNGRSNTYLTTSATTPSVSYTDTATNTSAQDLMTLYDGPVDYLQWQYIWSSNDSVALSASTPNVFLKSGAGQDALQVSGGTNVLDGGGNSNFLVGGTGAGSADTFFVDGRGGVVTWSTIVNFHQGDAATIFGFVGGTSTMVVSASDGVDGYKGVTIHSELGGAGTGVNASMTFTGLDLATFNAHFSIGSDVIGSGPSATPYLLVQYNR